MGKNRRDGQTDRQTNCYVAYRNGRAARKMWLREGSKSRFHFS